MTLSYWSTKQRLNFSWNQVAEAYWRRYPNPNSEHVTTEDFVKVSLAEKADKLRTKRVILKTNKLPSWGRHFFSARRVAVIEEAEVDLIDRTLTTYTRNIGLVVFMGTTEKCVYYPDLNDPNVTLIRKEVWISSDIFGFRSAIRKFGIDRFKKNSVAATEGFEMVLKKFYLNIPFPKSILEDKTSTDSYKNSKDKITFNSTSVVTSNGNLTS